MNCALWTVASYPTHGYGRSFQQGRLEAGEEIARLTPRQRDVPACIAEGLSNEEIAE